MNTTRHLRAAICLLVPLCLGASGDDPDWASVLQDGERKLEVSAWFDEDRTRGFVVVGEREGGFTSKVYRMWKIAVGDLDGDGTDEVILGVWSDVRRHDEPQPHRTVWVLSWDGERLTEAWRGSALARPLADFSVTSESSGAAHLVALERTGERCRRTIYQWNGFGFVGEMSERVRCGRGSR